MFNIGDVVVRKTDCYDEYWKRVCNNENVKLDSEFIVKGEYPDTIGIKFGPFDNLKVYSRKFELVNFSLENE